MKIIKTQEVSKILNISKHVIKQMVKEGKFPKPIPLSGRLVGWDEETIFKWLRKYEEAANESHA